MISKARGREGGLATALQLLSITTSSPVPRVPFNLAGGSHPSRPRDSVSWLSRRDSEPSPRL